MATRAFTSAAIERRIAAASSRVADPDVRTLLSMTLPNTLDTTVRVGGTDAAPDTFVVTGDIEEMWLRDSTAQVWPYLRSAPDDPALDRLLAASHAGTYLAHESFDADDPSVFTRPWFAWANSLVSELLEGAALDGLLA
jgi:meiotically up-regulated gene 157 (Mug157) protein